MGGGGVGKGGGLQYLYFGSKHRSWVLKEPPHRGDLTSTYNPWLDKIMKILMSAISRAM